LDEKRRTSQTPSPRVRYEIGAKWEGVNLELSQKNNRYNGFYEKKTSYYRNRKQIYKGKHLYCYYVNRTRSGTSVG